MAPASSRQKHAHTSKSSNGRCFHLRTCVMAVVCSWGALVLTLIINHAADEEPYAHPFADTDTVKMQMIAQVARDEASIAAKDINRRISGNMGEGSVTALGAAVLGEPDAHYPSYSMSPTATTLRPTPPLPPPATMTLASKPRFGGVISQFPPTPTPSLLPASPLMPNVSSSSLNAGARPATNQSVLAVSRTAPIVYTDVAAAVSGKAFTASPEPIDTALGLQPEGCTRVLLDDGFGAVPDTYVETTGKVGGGLLGVVPGDLCEAKVACQHSAACAAFVWRSGLQEAELLRVLPPVEEWSRWTGEDARGLAKEVAEKERAAAKLEAAALQREESVEQTTLVGGSVGSGGAGATHLTSSGAGSGKSTRHQRILDTNQGVNRLSKRQQALRRAEDVNRNSKQKGRRRLSSAPIRHQPLTPSAVDAAAASARATKKKKKFDPEQRKREAKEMAQSRASVAQSQGAGKLLGPVLYVKLATGDTLTQLLARFDKRPQLQQVMSGAAVEALWPLGNERAAQLLSNASTPLLSGSGLPGHQRVEYDLFRTSGEWWVDSTKAETVDGGICAVKASCAADENCEGFVWRVRDGAGLLGKGFKILDPSVSATKTKLARFQRKAPRGVMLYLKRPAPLSLGKGVTLVSGRAVEGKARGKGRASKGGARKEGSRVAASSASSSPATTTILTTILSSGTTVKASSSSLSSTQRVVCLNLSVAPWRGSPPFADPLRRSQDPEVLLLHQSGPNKVMADAYQADASQTTDATLQATPAAALTAKGEKKRRRKEVGAEAPVSEWALDNISRPLPSSIADPLPLPGSPGHQRVWISLTTLPGRINQIERTVLSLIHQSVPADEVVISVPELSEREGIAYPIPDWLDALVHQRNGSFPKVRVRRISEDFGPATKLIPSVMEAQHRLGENVLVLVVDDDTLYPRRLLETLLEWNRRLPHAALAFSGWPVVERTMRYPHWSENYLVYGNELFAPHPVSVIRGNCGYLVQTSFFDEELWEGYSRAPPGAFFMDDVWISGQLASKGIRRFVVPFDEDQFTNTPNLENVTTLDHVVLDKPSPLAAKLKEQKEAAAKAAADAAAGIKPIPQVVAEAGGAPSEGGVGAAAAAVAASVVSKFSMPQMQKQGNNRVQANEQALLHFRKNWDVLWDGVTYEVKKGGEPGRNSGKEISWLGR